MKHAFLIMAHSDPDILDELIKRLTHPSIMLFIHIDKKAKFNVKEFVKSHSGENIKYIKRNKVYWGSYSQINTTYRLLEEAYKERFDYYHLISGVTLPIKTTNKILDFFEKHKGMEFVDYSKNHDPNRYKKYHFFVRRPSNLLINGINKMISFIPRKTYYKIYKKSSNWFSITHNFAGFVLSKEKLIKKYFCFTLCCDEIFLATILYNSPFYKNCYSKPILYTDWSDIFESGGIKPSILSSKYLEILKSSQCIFARKFDSSYKEFYYKLFL